MKRLLSRFRRSAQDEAEVQCPPIAPTRLTFAVGDIHGCLEQLDTLLTAIAARAGSEPHDIVFLGDYVDRGPDSADVLRRLMALEEAQDADRGIICLLGNHDRMMLHFIEQPEDGVRWLWVGGQDTVISYGLMNLRVGAAGEASMSDRVAAQAAALAEAMGDPMMTWLAERPLWWQTGNIVAVHALTDPSQPMQAQHEETLLWARPDDNLEPRSDGTWVVHGHTIVSAPTVRACHVNVDTGAFRGGPLSAAVFAPGEDVQFLRHDRASDGHPS